MKKAYYFLQIFLQATNAGMKGFSKAASGSPMGFKKPWLHQQVFESCCKQY
jgi:hypothetical protein